jgi:hypothetical protein
MKQRPRSHERWWFKDYKNVQIASALVEIFDRIYTYPLLRWRAFGRSLLFTTVVSVIYVFEVAELMPPPPDPIWLMWLGFLFFVLLFNVFTDYLSLFAIRPVLVRSGAKPVIGLALGGVTGAAIVIAAHLLRILVLVAGSPAWWLQEEPFAQAFAKAASSGFIWAFAYSLVAVFIWLPLFALGIVAARALTPLSWIVGRTQWFLKEGKEHPLKAIGYVAAVVVFLGTVAGRAVFSA